MTGNEWDYVESRLEDLDAQLEYAKEHPFIVSLDFDTRIRVWQNQILRDRLLQLAKRRLIDDAVRYYDLSAKDYRRLFKRATKEFLEVADNPAVPAGILGTAQGIYEDRKALLAKLFSDFAEKLFRIDLRG